MTNEHPTEEQLQAHAMEPAVSASWVPQHIATCADCQRSIQMYSILFSALHEQPGPVFDFDVAALVLPALASPTTKRSPLFYLLSTLIAFAAAVPIYLLKENIANLFREMPQFFMYACAGSAFILVLVRLLQIIKNYKERFNLLNHFPDLQP